MTAELERLRGALLALPPAAFERVVLLGIAALTGRPMRQAAAGRQPSGDGAGGTVAVEAKRYRTGAPPARDLLGGLAGAVLADPALTHWVVATTVSLPLQALHDVKADADARQVRFVPLDWPTAGFPPLAAALIEAREAIGGDFPSLAEALAAVAVHGDREAVRAELVRQLIEAPPGLPIYDPSLIHGPGLSPSAPLDARYRIVPLMNREDNVAEWCAWAQRGDSFTRVLTGPGGMGKTRLFIEICDALRRSGYRAGFLRENAAIKDDRRLASQLSGIDRGLIVVDYAELRVAELAALCRTLLEHGARERIRIVLLARNAAGWLDELRDAEGPLGDVMSTAGGVEPIRLPPAAPIKRTLRQRQRRDVAATAAKAFASAVGNSNASSDWEILAGIDLERPEFDRILFLLTAVYRQMFDGPADRDDTWDVILKRERRHLSVPGFGIKPKAIMSALAWICAHDGADTRREAIDLLKRCDALYGCGDDTIMRLAETFHGLYRGPKWLNPIQPDLLASALMDAYPT